MRIVRAEVVPDKVRFHKIHCFTCKLDMWSKNAATRHAGHAVHYVNAAGEIDED